jgi:hypothetical protein
MENYIKISGLLTDLFDKIGLTEPSNFKAIAQYIFEDLQPLKDDIDDKCVAVSFKKWVQSKN